MQPCPICGQAGATCGGPSHNQPIDQLTNIVDEVTKVTEREMVMVHVDDGTDRGQDFRYERKDAEKFLAMNPNARIVGDEPEAKMVEKAPSNKSQAKAESK